MAASDFIGTYKLDSFELKFDDGMVEYPLGRDAEGLIIYTREGFFSGQMMQKGRPKFAQARQSAAQKDFGSDAEGARCLQRLCRYDVEEARKIVNHRIISALIPNWEGQVNVRHYEFKGEVLVLSSPPMIANGRQGRSVLHWRRCPVLY